MSAPAAGACLSCVRACRASAVLVPGCTLAYRHGSGSGLVCRATLIVCLSFTELSQRYQERVYEMPPLRASPPPYRRPTSLVRSPQPASFQTCNVRCSAGCTGLPNYEHFPCLRSGKRGTDPMRCPGALGGRRSMFIEVHATPNINRFQLAPSIGRACSPARHFSSCHANQFLTCFGRPPHGPAAAAKSQTRRVPT